MSRCMPPWSERGPGAWPRPGPRSPRGGQCVPPPCNSSPDMHSQPPTWAVSGEIDVGSGASPLSPRAFTPQVCLQLRPAETKAQRVQEVKTNSLREKEKKKKIKSLPCMLNCVRGRGGEPG